MIEVKRFVCNMLQENTYVVSDGGGKAAVIDCGALYEEERAAVTAYIRQRGLEVVHLLCTHGHFDHNFGNDTIWDTFHLKPEVAAEDEGLMEMKRQVSDMVGIDYWRPVPPVGHLLGNGERLSIGTLQLEVLPTPGHTPGSVTFYSEAEGVAFTGDTLFRLSIGRTDFEGGSWTDMSNSLRNVLGKLPAHTKVYPGHGEPTTIGDELRYNPYLR